VKAFFGRLGTGVRAARLVAHLLLAAVLVVALRIFRGAEWFKRPSGSAVIGWWMRRLCGVLRMRVIVHGRPVPSPTLFAANHISWLDIIAIMSVLPTGFVAKASVRQWPFVGWLAAACGTRFLERGKVSVLHGTLAALETALGEGQSVAVFPEGTTTSGESVGTFRPALLDVVGRAHTALQPLALAYRRNSERDRIAPFVGDDAFVPHLLRLLAGPSFEAHLIFCEPLHARDGGRRALAQRAWRRITAALGGAPGMAGEIDEATARATQSGCHTALL
jgi:1-acyl-sn-glycerol-3-phosphate acyltransferase